MVLRCFVGDVHVETMKADQGAEWAGSWVDLDHVRLAANGGDQRNHQWPRSRDLACSHWTGHKMKCSAEIKW